MGTQTSENFVQRTLKNTIAGTAGGIAVCLVGHPFDTLKVRLQTQPVVNPVYKGLTDCFLKTLKWEGVGGLYKGVGSPIVGQMFFRATLFTSYFQISTLVAGSERVGHRLQMHEYFICGAFTGSIAALIEAPIDLFKSKMQVQIINAKAHGTKPKYSNVFQCGYDITRQYGIRGAYQGLAGVWLRNIPANCFFFGFYEVSRTLLTPEGGTVLDLSASALLTSGAVGGFLYWFLTYPTDVIKSSLQADESDRSKRRFKGVVHCTKTLYTTEGGVGRFFRGFLPCLMRSLPANAAMFFVVEKTRQFLAHKL
ncbi:unnamed protein product [Owenia fusiformis]|uniref:Uncharacterized protein n=1 Tax=Owenia fusiformis TaxID=6347 RepID=A0A8S4N887_OWEFU|nr:unnamed protein product [Owenia fusiformis]